MLEYRKSVADLDKPMDGVGLATGNGDGDMQGVFIKDFAYSPEKEQQPGEGASISEEQILEEAASLAEQVCDREEPSIMEESPTSGIESCKDPD